MSRFLSEALGSDRTVHLPQRAGSSHPAAVHVFDEDSILAVDAALAASRPLLVRGEPGVGKSQLARASAQALGRAYVAASLDTQTEPRDLLWSFDAVARLGEAQVLQAAKNPDIGTRLAEKRFLRPGPLWWAFDWVSAQKIVDESSLRGGPPHEMPVGWKAKSGVVALLDEIDKADTSVPNGLLEALGSGRFEAPGLAEAVSRTGAAPLVIVTTNEERVLPTAFVRRCLVLRITLPAGEALRDFLVGRGRAHFPDVSLGILEEAAKQIQADREDAARTGLPAAGQAEFLDLIRAVSGRHPDCPEKQQVLLAQIAGFVRGKHVDREA